MSHIKYILFDAANTIIHKPLLWEGFQEVFKNNNLNISMETLKRNHKLLSESVHFPDRTSKDFYKKFNIKLLESFGFVPNDELLDEIFTSCTYLPWEKFPDTEILKSLKCKMGVLSNFNSSLKSKMEEIFGNLFNDIIVSEEEGIRKPELKFFELALKKINIDPNNILYIGDSIRLDIEPAEKLGINALLIDRDGIYPEYKKKINSLLELERFL